MPDFRLLAVFMLLSTAAAAAENSCRDNYVYGGEQSAKATYLQAQAIDICHEGNRILSQSNLMISEAERLRAASIHLDAAADHLDALWENAHHADPDAFKDYPGRARSQTIMRRDVNRMQADVEQLHQESQRLRAEADRLWTLAQQVDAEAVEARSKRFGSNLPLTYREELALRSHVITLARAMDVSYTPK